MLYYSNFKNISEIIKNMYLISCDESCNKTLFFIQHLKNTIELTKSISE